MRGVASFPSFAFDQFELNTFTRRLTRAGQPVTIADRHFDVLYRLVSSAGELVTKEALVTAGWGDVAVTDNSLEQAISSLRRSLGARADGTAYIETVPRRGYRFSGAVERRIARASDENLEALMAPHRAWLEGRAALETLEGEQISRARRDFEQVLQAFPDHATAHIGLANACAMRYEMTRADAHRDAEALTRAAAHAREACRLDPGSAEAWATLGFVHHCSGQPTEALAALRRAITTEPDNWRHQFRLAYAGWGEARLRAARSTLAMLPGFPLAHWLAATVHVARNVLDEAERELRAGVVGQDAQGPQTRFNAVALHWLLGLVLLAKGDEQGAVAEFERELAAEASGHLYARECCANTWYAIGALRLRQRKKEEAQQAFAQVLERMPNHRLVQTVLTAQSLSGLRPSTSSGVFSVAQGGTFDETFGAAVILDLTGQTAFAAQTLDGALAAAPPGNAGWLLPVEPLLNVAAAPDLWGSALSRLRSRAA